jgi:hypothetical protein
METMKLYRTLQQSVGVLNHLVVALYKGEVSADEALAKAREETQALAEQLTDEKE